jgi:hypothetical protein
MELELRLKLVISRHLMVQFLFIFQPVFKDFPVCFGFPGMFQAVRIRYPFYSLFNIIILIPGQEITCFQQMISRKKYYYVLIPPQTPSTWPLT